MKKSLKVINSALLISVLFLSSCGLDGKYSKRSDSDSVTSEELVTSDFSKLLAPQNIAFDADTKVLSWNGVVGASTYDINFNGKVIKTGLKDTTYTFKNSQFNNSTDEYLISIRAVNSDGTVKSNYTTFVYSTSLSTSVSMFTYVLDEQANEYAINGFSPLIDQNSFNDKEIAFGGEFKGAPITKIESRAFYNVRVGFNAKILSSIKEICSEAFSYSYVQSITFDEGVEIIGDSAFFRTSKLSSISFPASLKVIGKEAFKSSNIRTDNKNPISNPIKFASNSSLESIGDSAFETLSFETITFPASLKTIGNKAFYNNTKLKSIFFEENSELISLGTNAFEKATALTALSLPASVEVIGESCFAGCSRMATVFVPTNANLKEIGTSAFSGCNALKYLGNEEAYDPTSEVNKINLPSSVESIKDKAFTSLQIATINFASDSKLVEIGASAFASNAALKEISFPKSLKVIGENAFNKSSLTSVKFDADTSLEVMYGNSFSGCPFISEYGDETIILGKALYSLSKEDRTAKNVTIPNGVYSLSIKLFNGNTTIEKVTLNEELAIIGVSAFDGCTNLQTINIPNSVTTIMQSAFNNCKALTNLTFGNISSALLATIENKAFYNAISVASINLPDAVTYIGDSAFSCDAKSNTALTTFNFSNSSRIEKIGVNAFANQSKLQTLALPNSLKVISDNAFEGCSSLTTITLDNENSLLAEIGDSAFENTGLVSIMLPANLTKLGASAFKDCKSLTNVNFAETAFSSALEEDKVILSNTFEGCSSLVTIELPAAITTIDANAFLNATSLKEIISNATNINNEAFTNTAFEKDAKDGFIIYNGVLIRYLGNSTDITIDDNIIGINPGAFEGTTIEKVTISSSLTRIYESAFENCTHLKSVQFKDNSLLTEIGASAFKNCSNLIEFNFTGDLHSIGEYAFYNCISLTTIDLGSDYLTKIENHTFANCNSLSNVTLGKNITEIREYAFYQCSLNSITIPSHVETIGDFAFANIGRAKNNLLAPENWEIVPSLAKLSFANDSSLASIGSYAFANNAIEKIELPENVGLELGDFCFKNSKDLIDFKLDNGCEVGEGILFGSMNIVELETPSNISLQTLFGGNISMIPTTLKTIIIADGSTTIENSAFSGLGTIVTIVIPSTVTEIADYAFYGCRSLTSIDISNVTNIGKNAFYGCVNLSDIKFASDIDYIGDKALYATKYLNNHSNDEFVVVGNILVKYNGTNTVINNIPNNVTAIAGGAFSGNQLINSVKLGNNVSLICNGAFDSCTSLTSIELASTNLVEIELNVFDTLSGKLQILVSSNMLNSYKSNIYWSLYEDYLISK